MLGPIALQLLAACAGVPRGVDFGRVFEGAVLSAQHLAGGGDFGVAERAAVPAFGALPGRRAFTDDGLAADQRRPMVLGASADDGVVDGLTVVAVDRRDHLPTVGREAFRRVVGDPALHMAVDRNAV